MPNFMKNPPQTWNQEWKPYVKLPSALFRASTPRTLLIPFRVDTPTTLLLNEPIKQYCKKLRKLREVGFATLYHCSLCSHDFKYWWLVGKELGQSLSISGSFQSSMVIRQFPVRSSFCTQLEVKYTALQFFQQPMVGYNNYQCCCWPLLGQYPLLLAHSFRQLVPLTIITTIFNARIKR